MPKILLTILFAAAGPAYAGDAVLDELKGAAGTATGAVLPVSAPQFEAAKPVHYHFRCMAGRNTPAEIAPMCVEFSKEGRDFCESAGCVWDPPIFIDWSSTKANPDNRVGAVKGSFNGRVVDIKFTRYDWTFAGTLNSAPVNLRVDHEAGTVNGNVNNALVRLEFDWTPEQVTFRGAANNSPVNYTVNWDRGEMTGYANNAPLKVGFSRSAGAAGTATAIRGYANNGPVLLNFNEMNGRLGGSMNNGKAVSIDVINMEIGYFLQYLFVYLN